MIITPFGKRPIADLHCDLLCYLQRDPRRTADDPAVRCSIPQLREGNVKLQTLAIFAETGPGSAEVGKEQAKLFKSLVKNYPNTLERIRSAEQLEQLADSDKIRIVPAIENASAFCGEGEDLDEALKNLTAIQKSVGKLFYMSLTWNTENRFGGGVFTRVGLKNDGKRLLDYLGQRGIALDFSHASDYLAFDLLNYIDKQGLTVPVMASHSNLRSVANFARNLPDEIVREIIKREGLIGLNFIRYLLGGESPHAFGKHLTYLLSLGGGRQICFGADFFYPDDVSSENCKPVEKLFFPAFDHAGAYQRMVELCCRQLGLSNKVLLDLCYQNVVCFLKRIL